MNKEELFKSGNEAIRDALKDAIVIINSSGDALSRIGDTDKMEFSPTIDCTDDKSMLLFDDEDSAKRMIDDILVPQDGDESFIAMRISRTNPESGKSITSEFSSDGDTVTISKDGDTEEYSLEEVMSMLYGDDDSIDSEYEEESTNKEIEPEDENSVDSEKKSNDKKDNTVDNTVDKIDKE